MASTTIFERKGLRFGMESSPASAEVKGSTQAEERETEKRVERKREGGEKKEKGRKGERERGWSNYEEKNKWQGNKDLTSYLHVETHASVISAHYNCRLVLAIEAVIIPPVNSL